jgi:hypothetical protein
MTFRSLLLVTTVPAMLSACAGSVVTLPQTDAAHTDSRATARPEIVQDTDAPSSTESGEPERGGGAMGSGG